MKYIKLMILSLIFTTNLLSQDNLEKFIKAYSSQDMTSACNFGRVLYRSEMRDEKVLIAVGNACAKDDYIDFIGVLQQRLGSNKNSRRASVYFSTLVLEKRLILEFMNDNTNISSYSLPLTKHILSSVFEAIRQGQYTDVSVAGEEIKKHIHIGDARNYTEVYLKQKMYINVYEAGKKVQEHRYR